MANPLHNLMGYLRVASGAWRDDPRDDAEVLARFAESGDDIAFRVLIWRHGALVWRTCRRILGDTPDAEDAFQATFLSLARKAKRLHIKSPAGWLHQVARQAALDANAVARRHKKLEQRLQTSTKPEAKESNGQSELYAALDEELANLPERQRIPLILHYLEGKTQDEVARILGSSRTAVRKRLARGEAILRKQLERRGLALGAATVASLLGKDAVALTVPAGLMASTAQAAVAFRAGALTGVSAEAAEKLLLSLSLKGIIWKGWWMLLLCVGALGIGGAGLVAWKMFGDGSGVVEPAAPKAVTLKTASPEKVAVPHSKRVDRYGDPLPEGALARIGTLRFRPSKLDGLCASAIAFLHDSKTLVSLHGSTLCFWECATGKELRRLDGISGASSSIALSPDDKILATGWSYWDLTVNPPQQLNQDWQKLPAAWVSRNGGGNGNVAYSPDGRTVAWTDDQPPTGNSGLEGCLIYLVDTSTGKIKKRLYDDKTPKDICHGVSSMTFSTDSKTLAVGGASGRTVLWDVATGTKRLEISGNGRAILFLAFLPDGRTLLESRVNARNWAEMLSASDGPERMRFLDTATGEDQRQASLVPSLRGKSWLGQKCISPDGKFLAFNNNNVISVWDMATGREVGPTESIPSKVERIILSPDNKNLVSLSYPFQLWETDTGRLKQEVTIHLEKEVAAEPSIIGHMINQRCAYYSDDRHLEVLYNNVLLPSSAAKAWNLLRWDTKTGKIEQAKEKIPGALTSLLINRCFAVSSNGRWLALALTNGIALVDRATGKEVHRFPQPPHPNFLAFSADGQSLLVDCEERHLIVWSTTTGKQRMSLDLPTPPGSMISWWPLSLSPDGTWLAIVSQCNATTEVFIHLWEVESGKESRNKLEAPDGIFSLAWSPDERLLAGGGKKGLVWLWDVASGQELRRFTGHRCGDQSGVTSLTFSSDGCRLISGSEDTTALVWDTSPRIWELPGLSPSAAQAVDQSTASALWGSLQSKDAVATRRSIYRLTRDPDVTLPLLRERLRPTFASDQKAAVLLSQLDDDDFQVRKRAEEQLLKMLREAQSESILRQAQDVLAKGPSLEVSRVINRVLGEVLGPGVGPSDLNMLQLQACRGVEVLERIGTPAARQLLEELSQLPTGYVQSVEAKAALHRLSKPTSAPTP